MKPYLQSADEVLRALESAQRGLASAEAAARLEREGMNLLDDPPRPSLLVKIWNQVRDPMVIVLLLAALLSALFKEWADMAIILIVVALNACLGIYQEGKAEKAIEALRELSAPQSRVRRDGAVRVIPSNEIVRGDIVLLEAGDSVPADLRLIEAASLRIEEALLTGESVPAEKQTAALENASLRSFGKGIAIPLPTSPWGVERGDEGTGIRGGDGGQSDAVFEDVVPGDQTNMAFSGSSVVYGRGAGVAVSTGMNTEIGRIAGILSAAEDEQTPLQQTLAGLSKILSIGVLIVCALVFGISILLGGTEQHHMFNALLTAISLAVAAIPEGLVVVVTILLSIGIKRMSERSAIIRRLTAVETLGCAQVICSDKTGTITQNRMTVTESFGHPSLLPTALAFANDAQETQPPSNWIGDPTEIALAVYARASNIDLPGARRVGEAPFDSIRKRMSVVVESAAADGESMVITQYTKGGLDEVLSRCDRIQLDAGEPPRPITDADRARIQQENSSMTSRALRVLAAAVREWDAPPDSYDPETLETRMIFVGFAGMIDPVRPEALDAVRVCARAGLRTIMITGDHKDTAVAIAKELGILTDPGQAITGAELAKLSDEEFERRIDGLTVYARVQPEHKVRIVSMWRKKGRVTAMTGDGVNDAPAIKAADIGVGMGITGTDVTKNVADVVLADDNFATIVYAVEEGRRIYENIRKAVQFLLSSNLSEVVAIFIATLANVTLFAPIHILWINLVTDTFPAMALGVEPAEADVMDQPPRDPKESLFANGLGIETAAQGVFIALLTLASYFAGAQFGAGANAAVGTTMAFLTLSLCEVFHSFNLRSRTRSLLARGPGNPSMLWSAALSILLTFAVVYTPRVHTYFSLISLSARQCLTASAFAAAILPFVEAYKAIKRGIISKRELAKA
ncbi:MAG: cation-translocating P-type ATPase [Oscillospiraceae bacterium]|jgi:Ca2+-transporting ATPase|nr:cation-translocating P-type ATPase [Oscillospiraceae bacterium]